IETLSRYLGTNENQTRSSLPEVEPNQADVILSEFREDPGLMDLVRHYVDGLPGQVTAMRSLLSSGDTRGIESLAHKTRGVGGMYGYPCLTETASLIEDAG